MIQDQSYSQNLQAQNNHLKSELNRMVASIRSVQDKYQKSLKEMSAIIQANRKMKVELDQIKIDIRSRIDRQVSRNVSAYSQKQQMHLKERDNALMEVQRLQTQNNQIKSKLIELQKQKWQVQTYKNEISILKKQNENLLLEQHPLVSNPHDNPESREKEEKLLKFVDELKQQIQSEKEETKKQLISFEAQKQKMREQIDSLRSEVNQNEKEHNYHQELQTIKHKDQSQELNKMIVQLKGQKSQLMNQLQKVKLGVYQRQNVMKKQSEAASYNQIEQHLIETLKNLHAQLQPMRYELQQLRRDKYYEAEAATSDKAQLQMKLMKSHNQAEGLKNYIKELEDRNHILLKEKRQSNWNKDKMHELQEEKRILQGRIIVYEAMELVARNRDENYSLERISEFERRIKLLIEDESMDYNLNSLNNPDNLHQLIAMKAYILQLDSKLQSMASEHDHLHKRYQQYKQRYQEIHHENKLIVEKHKKSVEAYKGKIIAYEKLVNKLTLELQKYISQFSGSEVRIEESYKSMMVLYETKITNLYQQINSLKSHQKEAEDMFRLEKEQLIDRIKSQESIETEGINLRSRNNQLQNKIGKLELQLEMLRQQVSSRNSIYSEDDYKRFLLEKNKRIIELEEVLQKLESKLNNIDFEHERQIETFTMRISRLQAQLSRLRQENLNLSQIPNQKKSYQIDILLTKITHLQASLQRASRPAQSSPQQVHHTSDIDLNKFHQENAYLRDQIEKIRHELKQKIMMKNNQIQQIHAKHRDQIFSIKEEYEHKIRELREKIMGLESELSIKRKQNEFKDKQLRASEPHTEEDPHRYLSLEQSNIQLRNQLQTYKKNNIKMAQESESLIEKIRELQNYLRNMGNDYDSVSKKIQNLERELNTKETIIKEKEMEYRKVSQRYEREVVHHRQHDANAEKANKFKIREDELRKQEEELERIRQQINRQWKNIGNKEYEIEQIWADIERRDKSANQRQEYLLELQRQLQSHESTSLKIQRENNSLKSEVQRLQQELMSQTHKQKTVIVEPSAEQEKQIASLKITIEQMQSKHENEMISLRSKYSVRQNQLNHTIEMMQMDLKSRSSRIQWILKDLQSQKVELEAVRKQGHEKDNKYVSIKKQMQIIKETIFEKDMLIQKLQKHSNKQQSTNIHEIQQYKQQIQRMQRTIEQLQNRPSQPVYHATQTIHESVMPQSIYESKLIDENSRLENDLQELRHRFININNDGRSMDDYLGIMVLTFAEIQALRERVKELEESFNKEHQNSLNALVQLEKLRDVDSEVHYELIKEIEQAHKLIHEDQNISRKKYLQKREVYTSIITRQEQSKLTTMNTSFYSQRPNIEGGVESTTYETKYIQPPTYNEQNMKNYYTNSENVQSPYRVLNSQFPSSQQVNEPGMIQSRTQLTYRSQNTSQMSQPEIYMPSQTSLRNKVSFGNPNAYGFANNSFGVPMQSLNTQRSYENPYIVSNNQLLQ